VCPHFLFTRCDLQVGVLTSHVHSIVMSSNGMEGRLPTSISQLRFLRMIELATMPGKPAWVSIIGTLTLTRSCVWT
jgi:hypothetical protein